MSIYDGYTVNVNFRQNKCELNEDVHLYKNDENVPLYFEFVEYIGSGFSPKLNKLDLLNEYNVDHVKMLILAPNGMEYQVEQLTVIPVETIQGDNNVPKFQFIVEAEMIDDFNEIGDYDIQFRFYHQDECVITLPPIIKQFHVHKPIVNDSSAIDVSQIGGIIKEETPLVAFIDGLYVKTNWVNRMLITSGKMNKIENGIYDTSLRLKIIESNYGDYDTLENKPFINGKELKGNVSLSSLGVAREIHSHDYAQVNHNHDIYAEKEHSHSNYSELNHSHSDYAPLNHDHHQYSLNGHLHDEYADRQHNHDYESLNNLPNLVDGLQLVDGKISLTTGANKVGNEIELPNHITGLKFEEGRLSLQNDDGLVGEEIDLPKYADGMKLNNHGQLQLVQGDTNIGSSIDIPMGKFKLLGVGNFSRTSSEVLLYSGFDGISEIKIRLSEVNGTSNSAIYISINDREISDIVYTGMSLSTSAYGMVEIEDYGYYLVKYAFGGQTGNANWITRNHFSDSYNTLSDDSIEKISIRGTNLSVGHYEIWGR